MRGMNLRGMNSASVDLIYLDLPFKSNANYAAPIGSQATGAAFKDTWTLSDIDVEWVNLMEAKGLTRFLNLSIMLTSEGHPANAEVPLRTTP